MRSSNINTILSTIEEKYSDLSELDWVCVYAETLNGCFVDDFWEGMNDFLYASLYHDRYHREIKPTLPEELKWLNNYAKKITKNPPVELLHMVYDLWIEDLKTIADFLYKNEKIGKRVYDKLTSLFSGWGKYLQDAMVEELKKPRAREYYLNPDEDIDFDNLYGDEE